MMIVFLIVCNIPGNLYRFITCVRATVPVEVLTGLPLPRDSIASAARYLCTEDMGSKASVYYMIILEIVKIRSCKLESV